MSPDRALPPPALAIQRWLLFVGAIGLVAIMVIVYSWGFDRGRADSSLDFARRAECRATLAVPVNAAKDEQQAAFGIGMIAGLLGEDPEIRADLIRLVHESPDAALRENARAILVESNRIRSLNVERGDPVKACEDGKP